MCLPESGVAASRYSSSHPAGNVRSRLWRSACMRAVKCCCPAHVGLNVGDQSPDRDAPQSLCRAESADIFFGASPKTL